MAGHSCIRAALQIVTSSQTLTYFLLLLSLADAWQMSQKIQAFVLQSRVESLNCSIGYNKVYLWKSNASFELCHCPVGDGITSKFNNSEYEARTWREVRFPWSRIFMGVNMSPETCCGIFGQSPEPMRGEVGAEPLGGCPESPAVSPWRPGVLQTAWAVTKPRSLLGLECVPPNFLCRGPTASECDLIWVLANVMRSLGWALT